ncbi:hypothetical protein G7Y29_00310 [Corynebacterium qintianiae]|uniref:Secreted protein n=1 Tax=Corynebacterium qintianiae TaxID=2709392 RepID=A0A7T0KMN7_9CORY|nr:hypothetical protein [Corynebacterium qintianiae]QPK83317.1 hypothetical protein G7Y29_00310 [Corynebacterium qintianiae]
MTHTKSRMTAATAAAALALTLSPSIADAQSTTTKDEGSSLGGLLFGTGENEKSTPEKIVVILGIVTFIINAISTGGPMIQQLLSQIAPR